VEPLTGLMGPNKSDSEQRHALRGNAVEIGDACTVLDPDATSNTSRAEVGELGLADKFTVGE
jgi:hypothetical protein